ncbi:MAG: hypothetical protein Q7U76_04410 [Nitrospirota bacterium]|nr:hypothetical protein [Nitrospirota bacterium]
MMNNRAVVLVMLLGMLPVGSALAAEQEPPSAGRVEVVLADEHRKNVNEIKQEFAEAGLTNIHIQFMKVGRPPTNIGVGPQVTAERARAAIRLAKHYNRGITILLPERLFPDHYVTIASSSFDDTVEYPVNEEAMKELENPVLTTEQFHALYRRLTPANQLPVKKGRVF